MQPTTADPPAAEGGTIQDGTYELIQLVAYDGLGAQSLIRATKVISQGNMASTVVDGQTGNTIMSSGPYTVSGTTLTWSQSCPNVETLTYSFAAGSSSLILYQPSRTLTIAQLYARQP